MKFQKIREWIEKIIDEKKNIYVVIVYHILINVRILKQLKKQNFVDENLIILILTTLTAFDVIVSFNIADFEFSDFCDHIEN